MGLSMSFIISNLAHSMPWPPLIETGQLHYLRQNLSIFLVLGTSLAHCAPLAGFGQVMGPDHESWKNGASGVQKTSPNSYLSVCHDILRFAQCAQIKNAIIVIQIG